MYLYRMNQTWTITFGEGAENHKGMQQLGKMADKGFTVKELKKVKKIAKEKGLKTKLIKLDKYLPEKYKNKFATENLDARILIVKNGIKLFLNDKDSSVKKFNKEIEGLKNKVDKKAFMYGRVVNKTARYNLCFGDKDQTPDYKNKKGTIISFKKLKYLNKIRKSLPDFLGEKAKNLLGELNYYYDVGQCFISPHGDGERKRVIALRLGANFPLHYQWYYKSKKIGKQLSIELSGNDFYVMSEKAVGNDWLIRNIPTLRHSAGLKNVLKIK